MCSPPSAPISLRCLKDGLYVSLCSLRFPFFLPLTHHLNESHYSYHHSASSCEQNAKSIIVTVSQPACATFFQSSSLSLPGKQSLHAQTGKPFDSGDWTTGYPEDRVSAQSSIRSNLGPITADHTTGLARVITTLTMLQALNTLMNTREKCGHGGGGRIDDSRTTRGSRAPPFA